MRKVIKTTLIFTLVFMFSLFLHNEVKAATLWLDPTSGTYGKGATLKVNIGVNTQGEAINAVQANLTYPTDKLQFKSIATGGSALTIFAEKTASGGVVRIGGGRPTPGFTGSRLIGAVYFTVIGDSGTANLSFAGDSAVLKNSDNSNALSGSSTATFTISGTASAPAAGGDASDDTETEVDETGQVSEPAFEINDVSVSNLARNSATITWTTTQPATSVVEYGLSKEYNFQEGTDEFVTEHSIALPPDSLEPGTRYFFRVKGVDEEDNEVVGEDMELTTKGFAVTIKVVDEGSSPVEGATVELYSIVQKGNTDENGEVTFEDVSAGRHDVIVKHNGASARDTIDVSDQSEEPTVKEVRIKADVDSARSSMVLYGILGYAALVIVVFAAVVFIRKRKGGGGGSKLFSLFGKKDEKSTVVNDMEGAQPQNSQSMPPMQSGEGDGGSGQNSSESS